MMVVAGTVRQTLLVGCGSSGNTMMLAVVTKHGALILGGSGLIADVGPTSKFSRNRPVLPLFHRYRSRPPEADEVIPARITAVAVSAQGEQQLFPARNLITLCVPGAQADVEASGTFSNSGFRK